MVERIRVEKKKRDFTQIALGQPFLVDCPLWKKLVEVPTACYICDYLKELNLGKKYLRC